MAKYIKKPVEVDAFQYDGDLKGSDGNYYVPEWAVEAFEGGVIYYDSWDGESEPCELFICTSENYRRYVNVGNYIIRNENGELYSCSADIFEREYEKV